MAIGRYYFLQSPAMLPHSKCGGTNPHYTRACAQLQGYQERVLRVAGLEITALLTLLTGRKARPAMPVIAAVPGGQDAEDDEAEALPADDAQDAAPNRQPVEDEIPPAKEPGRDGFRHSGVIESIAHQAVHNPAVPHDGCEDCLVGAKREAPFVANASRR